MFKGSVPSARRGRRRALCGAAGARGPAPCALWRRAGGRKRRAGGRGPFRRARSASPRRRLRLPRSPPAAARRLHPGTWESPSWFLKCPDPKQEVSARGPAGSQGRELRAAAAAAGGGEGTGRGAAVCGPAARRARAGLPGGRAGRAGRAAEPAAGPSSAAARRGHGKMAAAARGQMAALVAAGQRRLRRARSRRPGGSARAGAGPLPPFGCSPGRALGQPWAAAPRLPGELPGVGSAAHRDIGNRTERPALEITKPGSLGWARQREAGQRV